MKVFIFKDVEYLTSRYHSDGGLVVIAKDRAMVERVIEDTNKLTYNDTDDFNLSEAQIELTEEDWDKALIYPTDTNVKVDIFVFPNAGCC